jgi:hypothetical protein
MRRLVATLFTTLLTLALLAPVALAHDGGQGTYGPTNDKVVTNAGFIVIAFIPLFVGLMSFIQWRLDVRKKRRKTTLPSRDWAGGW